jgi:hypothetical protein
LIHRKTSFALRSNGLTEGVSPRLSVGSIESRLLQPSVQGTYADLGHAGSLFYVALRKQSSDHFFLLSGDFTARTCHIIRTGNSSRALDTPEAIEYSRHHWTSG